MAGFEWLLFLPEVVGLVTYPDRIPHAHRQPALRPAASDVFTAALTPPQAPPVFPDRLPSARSLPRVSVFGPPPQPERTASLAASVYPDAIRRPALPSALHWYATAPPAAPERSAPLAAIVYPDAISRPALRAAAQLAATSLPPAPERTSPIAVATYPDAVWRPALPVALHFAVTPPPQPEESVPDGWRGVWPDAVRRPANAPASWLALAPQPLVPLPFVSFPARLSRPSLPALGFVSATIALEAPAPVTWQPIYPARVMRPWLGPEQQQAFAYGKPSGALYALAPCPVIPAYQVEMPAVGARPTGMPALAGAQVTMPTEEAGEVRMPAVSATEKC